MSNPVHSPAEGEGPWSRVLPVVSSALHRIGAAALSLGEPKVGGTPSEQLASHLRALMEASQAMHDIAASLVGRNDHTMAEFVAIQRTLNSELIADEDSSSRLEVSVLFSDPEQCVRMARLVGTPDVFTIQGFDAYRYARVESHVPGGVVHDELFLVVERRVPEAEPDEDPTAAAAAGIVAILPLDPDSLQWESALRGDAPEDWLREFGAFIRQDAEALAAQLARARRSGA
ncbi:hypothetical protein [Motilibacter aurantiacus]|uniref:hypothetical protein n=1 Tax=Motilibacter aurantiacus TaxID=2714955 RepID=UPI0014083DA5|nr:hypothetical protein [Motilibacter aurantiacus]NHC46257.1 hypothetical protein [Motilibacter aurantiacus]